MILRKIDKQRFANLAEPHLGVFGSEKWLSVYGDNLCLVGIFRDEHQMVGGFYYFKTSRLGLPLVKLPPYSPHCGLFYVSEGRIRSVLQGFTKEVMSEVVSWMDAERSILTILAFPGYVVDLQPFIWRKYKVVPNYTYRIDLQRSMEEIRSDFAAKNRNAISKALKEDVTTQKNALGKQELFEFFSGSLKAAGANVYEKELYNIFHHFSGDHNSFSFLAMQNGKRLGLVFCIYDRSTCYYLLGGIVKGSGVQGVNNLLVQKSIEEAQALGCGTFDFEGSMIEGVEKFFRSFGGELVPYFTVNKAWLPLEMALKFKKRELF